MSNYIMELSFANNEGKIIFLDSSTLEDTYLVIKEENGTANPQEVMRLELDDDDLETLKDMITMIQLQRKEEC